MDSISDQKYVPIPQWKQDLIARLKNGTNKATSTFSSTLEVEQQCDHSPQVSLHPEAIVSSRSASDVVVMSRGLSSAPWNVSASKSVKSSDMVSDHQEHCKHSLNFTLEKIDQFCQNGEESDPDDLHYGPGIVKKLKNKYLSLALRESNSRPSILHLRKATSLENVLEDDIYIGTKQFQSQVSHYRKKAVPNRYRNGNRPEIKRARSVETISKLEDVSGTTTNTFNRQSFHEDLLFDLHTENNTFVKKSQDNQFIERTLESKYNNSYCNRPKKIQPIVNDNEKPPPEFVKQTKKIFERRPEQRTRPPVQTGDVAAKVHNFNNIIVKAKVEAKVSKKLSNKHNKPVNNDKSRGSVQPIISKTLDEADQDRYVKKNNEMRKEPSLASPIPDVSMIEFPKNRDNDNNRNNSLSETPDLILTSSPVSNISLMKDRNPLGNSVFNKEIRNPDHLMDNNVTKKFTSPVLSPTSVKPASPLLTPSPNRSLSPLYRPLSPSHSPLSPSHRPLSPLGSLTKSPNAPANNLTETDNKTNIFNESELEIHSNSKADPSIPLLQTLKVDINELDDTQTIAKSRYVARSPPKFSPPPPPETELIKTEIENLRNNVRTVEAKGVEVINKNVLVRKTVPREQSATTVFNFTNRKDVPDYISNDQSRAPSYPKWPKPEDGVILLPTSNLDLLIDEDEELIKSLEGPPSPCDVTFINDNILIDGKSSFIQKTKQVKLKISFVDDADIFEYPSETSLILEESSSQDNSSGSFLSNYVPKSTEDFHLGVTRSNQAILPDKPDIMEVEQSPVLLLKETDTPFSSGTDPDILF